MLILHTHRRLLNYFIYSNDSVIMLFAQFC